VTNILTTLRHWVKSLLGLYYKTFFGRNLRIFMISESVFPSKPFQSSLMFVGKAGTYPREASFSFFTLGQTPEAVFLVVCDPSMKEL
jgi:hypothetical protein